MCDLVVLARNCEGIQCDVPLLDGLGGLVAGERAADGKAGYVREGFKDVDEIAQSFIADYADDAADNRALGKVALAAYGILVVVDADRYDEDLVSGDTAFDHGAFGYLTEGNDCAG